MATCTDCKLRGWSESTDENGEAVRLQEVIDLCPLHAAAGDMLGMLRLIRIYGCTPNYDKGEQEQLDAIIARAEGRETKVGQEIIGSLKGALDELKAGTLKDSKGRLLRPKQSETEDANRG